MYSNGYVTVLRTSSVKKIILNKPVFLGFSDVWWHIGILCRLKIGSPPVAYGIFNDPFLAKKLKSDLLIGQIKLDWTPNKANK